MKKIITLMVMLVGMVSTASAGEDLYLRSDGLQDDSWTANLDAYKFSCTWDESNSQDVYELTIGTSKLTDANDFYFRLYRNGSSFETSPSGSNDYEIAWIGNGDAYNGQWETYHATSGSEYQGTDRAFCVKHSTIKASEYKITVYLKYDSPWNYYIKVEIVNMPVTISAGKATFNCDRALNFSGTGINAYMITDASKGLLTTSSAMTLVPANTGLYLEGANDTYNVPVVETSAASEVSTSGNMLHSGAGTTVYETEGGYINFILTTKTTTNANAPLKFYRVNDNGNTVPKNKAYLQISTESVGARQYFWFDDDPTSINPMLMNKEETNSEYFNLNGQRVAQPTKGLYIVNGKKIFMK